MLASLCVVLALALSSGEEESERLEALVDRLLTQSEASLGQFDCTPDQVTERKTVVDAKAHRIHVYFVVMDVMSRDLIEFAYTYSEHARENKTTILLSKPAGAHSFVKEKRVKEMEALIKSWSAASPP
jgi:hypothetical protein